MRILLLTAFVIFTASACNSRQEKPKVMMMNVKDINLGPVIQESLTAGQIQKIKQIQQTFREVYPATLEETITNFKRDQHPDKEIDIWLKMASAYEMFVQKHTNCDSIKKQEAFKLILLRSMMPSREALEQAQVKVLSQEERDDLLHYYQLEAVPITTRFQ
jgi:hypothetical protein